MSLTYAFTYLFTYICLEIIIFCRNVSQTDKKKKKI